MTDHATVAAVQFHTRPRQPDANAETAQMMITEAARRGAALAVLPEYCLSGYEHSWVADGAPGAAADSTVLGELTRAVEHLSISVVLGDLERSGDRLYSTSFILTGGQVVGRHRKSILTESEAGSGLARGESAAKPVALPGLPVPVAPMVCFEHGFPEIALDLALAGAGVIAISSAIETGDEYLRNLRTRARAQDNGCYVLAANSVGGRYCGESMIVDPRGEVLRRASSTDGDVLLAEIDVGIIEQQRRLEPVLTLRRPELRHR